MHVNREPEADLTPGFSGSGNLLLTRNRDLDFTVHRTEIIILAYCSIYILHTEQGLIISRLLIKDLDEKMNILMYPIAPWILAKHSHLC